MRICYSLQWTPVLVPHLCRNIPLFFVSRARLIVFPAICIEPPSKYSETTDSLAIQP